MIHTLNVGISHKFVVSTQTVNGIIEMTGLSREAVLKVIEKGIEMGALEKVGPDEFKMTDDGHAFASHLMKSNSSAMNEGNWTCTKCKRINNALNGMNCTKCNYSYTDNLAAQAFEKEKRESKFPNVTEREMLLFLLGQLTGISMTIPTPKGSFAETLHFQSHIAMIMSELMSEIKSKFPHVSDEEFEKCLHQLHAIRTTPFIKEALKKFRGS